MSSRLCMFQENVSTRDGIFTQVITYTNTYIHFSHLFYLLIWSHIFNLQEVIWDCLQQVSHLIVLLAGMLMCRVSPIILLTRVVLFFLVCLYSFWSFLLTCIVFCVDDQNWLSWRVLLRFFVFHCRTWMTLKCSASWNRRWSTVSSLSCVIWIYLCF